MICPNCKRWIDEKEEVCLFCGTVLHIDESDDEETRKLNESEILRAEKRRAKGWQSTEKTKRSMIPYLIAAFVILCGIGIGVIIHYSKGDKIEVNTSNSTIAIEIPTTEKPENTEADKTDAEDVAAVSEAATEPTTEEVTEEIIPAVEVAYAVQGKDEDTFSEYNVNGNMAGSTGKGMQLEAIKIKLSGNPKLGIEYSAHCQGYGWKEWSKDDAANGTFGESKRIEAVKIRLTGEDKDKYDVYYRVHAQHYGWLAWTMNGEPCGTANLSRRLEALQVVVLKKGEEMPGVDYANVKASEGAVNTHSYIEGDIRVSYKTHLQSYGWLDEVEDGIVSGKPGEEKQMEAFSVQLQNQAYGGSVTYRALLPDDEWQEWKKEGETAGTVGESKRIKAIQIALDGRIGENYSIYYRVLTNAYGWLGWAKNGETAGALNDEAKVIAVQIAILPNGKEMTDEFEGVKADMAASYFPQSDESEEE